ncbi:hypothetical protein K9M79_04850 [Candidatus Woesearchaeota archaeon]|nr:hypothetical protein [Candidatus Woesearchaeota archaeon]
MPYCEFNGVIPRFTSACSVGYGCMVINPPLSLFPCVSLFMKGPSVLSVNKDIGSFLLKYYGPRIRQLKWKTGVFEKCDSCVYRMRKKCQGGCLTYKTQYSSRKVQ